MKDRVAKPIVKHCCEVSNMSQLGKWTLQNMETVYSIYVVLCGLSFCDCCNGELRNVKLKFDDDLIYDVENELVY